MTQHRARITVNIVTTDHRGHEREATTDLTITVEDGAPLSEIADDAVAYCRTRLREDRP